MNIYESEVHEFKNFVNSLKLVPGNAEMYNGKVHIHFQKSLT